MTRRTIAFIVWGVLLATSLAWAAFFDFGNPANYDVIRIAPSPKGSASFVGKLTTADLTAAQTWTMPNASGTFLIAEYGGMYQYTGAAATAIATAAEYYALTQMVTGLQQGFTFIAGVGGGPGAAISAVADGPSAGVNITVSAPGAWVAGQPVTLHGTTNYDGAYLITATNGSTTFVVTKAYVQTRTGVARGAAALKANAGSAGTYEVGFTGSVLAAASQTFHAEANKNTTAQDNVASKAQTSANSFYRTLAGLGHFTIADGDVVWMTIYNDSGASNLTVEMINVTVKRIGS